MTRSPMFTVRPDGDAFAVETFMCRTRPGALTLAFAGLPLDTAVRGVSRAEAGRVADALEKAVEQQKKFIGTNAEQRRASRFARF